MDKELLHSKTKRLVLLIEQTQTQPQETLEVHLIKSNEMFQFNILLELVGKWMMGLTNLDGHNSVFIIKEENDNFIFERKCYWKDTGLIDKKTIQKRRRT